MSIAVFGIDLAGIASMQKVVAVSNMHAKNVSIATHIAESWLDMLSADSAQWNKPSPAKSAADRGTDTAWFTTVLSNPTTGTGWVTPPYSANFGFGPYFDALGNPQSTATGATFCTNLRLSWLYPENGGNGLVRAEVRVYWLCDGQTSPSTATEVCAENPTVITANTGRFHFVQKVTAVRQGGT